MLLIAREVKIVFMKRWIVSIASTFESLLNQPIKVVSLCLLMAFANLVVDGTLLQLWSLQRNINRIGIETEAAKVKMVEVRKSVAKASDPEFLEMQARERFDLVGEDDLVFVFSEETH
jgi:hypothetical protein